MNASKHPVMQRFEAFLGKIYGRLQEIMTEAEQGLQGLMAQNPEDFMSYQNAMSGLEHRYSQLRDRLEQTWDDQIQPLFEEADLLDPGLDRKADAQLDLDARWNQWKATMVANFYRNLWPRAQAQLAEPVNCTQCGTGLQVPDPTVMSNVQCPSCSAINQVAPPPAVSAYSGAASAYADEECVRLRSEIERFRHEVDLWRRDRDWAPEPLESLERWEQMERNYWTTWAQAVARHSGKPVDTALVEARMKQFIQFTLEMNQTWVRAKGRVPA